MDFAALCPEINSGLMYNGPGSGPMMAAATAWKSLAAELDFTASAYQAVVSGLIGAPWLGPASASMAAAAAPYVEWIRSTAAAAEHAAAQATASAAAFETAFAMTVPPPVIAANRALLAGLIATNILGQNTPAIMATEAQYMEMWAQDAAAMYGYAGSSASHATLNCLTSPASTTNPGGLAGQAVAVTCAAALGISDQGELSGLISTLPSTMQGLASALTGPGGSGIMTGLDSFLGIPFVSNAVNGMVNSAALFTYNGISNAVLLGRAVAGSGPAAAAEVVGADSLADGLSQTVRAAAPGTGGSAGFGATPVWAAAGRASSVGGLSVPASWSAATSASRAGAVTLTVAGWTAASDSESMSIVPAGIPSVASATRGVAGLGAPRYGSKPTVIPRPLGIG